MSRAAAVLVLAVACSGPRDPGSLTLDSVNPASGANDVDVAVQLLGENFTRPIRSSLDTGQTQIGDFAILIGGMPLSSPSWRDETMVEGVVPAGLTPGLYDVAVRVGADSDVLTDGYEVLAPGGMPPPPPPMPSPYAITGQRWLLPCFNNLGNFNCNCAPVLVGTIQLNGSSSERFLVTAHIRGVMEAMGYTGGTPGPPGWYVGGQPGDNANNVYSLGVSSPPQVYWLNNGTPTSQRSFSYDYSVDFLVDGDATIVFTAGGQDTLQWGNYDGSGQPMQLAGVTTTPDPYDGQFAQIDITNAVLQ